QTQLGPLSGRGRAIGEALQAALAGEIPRGDAHRAASRASSRQRDQGVEMLAAIGDLWAALVGPVDHRQRTDPLTRSLWRLWRTEQPIRIDALRRGGPQ